MDIKHLTDEISVTGQIDPSDMPKLRAMGYKSIVCNRPDGEEADQPLFEELEKAAELNDIEAHYLPVSGSTGVTQADRDAFETLRPELPRPVLMFCRTGARSAKLTGES